MYRTQSIFTFLFFLMMSSASAQLDSTFTLPETWERDFVITLSHHSSMSGGKTEIRITYDSCIYFSQQSHSKKPKTRTYKMKAGDRAQILKKLTELKIDRVKSESSVHAVHDGWSQTICFNFHCLDGGTSAEMSEADKNTFLDAFRYLEEFAGKKAR